MENDILLDVRDLRIVLNSDGDDVHIVDGINFDITPGKVLAVVGESGCGKSVTSQSLLRLLPHELRIASGRINFRDPDTQSTVDLASMPQEGKAIRNIRGNHIAMIFQEPMSSFSLLHTMGNQIGEVIRLHRKTSKAETRVLVIELLDKVGIPDPERAIDQYPYEFSGGMRQRAMIAKALACNPSLLIADEPTTALDVTIQAQILDLMRGLQAEFGMAIIFITHDLGVVAQIADEVAIMYMGRIIEKGPVHEIFHDPRHPYTICLIRAIPKLGDLRAQRQLTPIRGTVPSLFDLPAGCTFHPRCDFFMAGRCDAQLPELTEITPQHFMRCFLHETAREKVSS